MQSLAFLFAFFSDKQLITYSAQKKKHLSIKKKTNIFPTNWVEISISGLYFHLPPDSGLIEKKVIQMRKQIEAKQMMAGSVIHSKLVSLEGLMLTSMLTPSKMTISCSETGLLHNKAF